jgi:hypothetical protein
MMGDREKIVDEKNWQLALGVVKMWTTNKKKTMRRKRK